MHPSRHSRDPKPHPAATRWTDHRLATAYATRIDLLDRETAWPALTPLLTPATPRRRLGRPDAVVLELGAGIAAYAHHLAEHHWTRTHAVDISPTLHRIGEKRHNDAWILRTTPDRAGRIPLRPGQCTAALAHLTLCHQPTDAHTLALLTETRRALRPRATLALVEPGEFGRDFQLLRYGHPHAAAEPRDAEPYPIDYTLTDGTRLRTTAHHRTPDHTARLLAHAGFTLDEIRPLPLPGYGGTPFTLWTAHAAP